VAAEVGSEPWSWRRGKERERSTQENTQEEHFPKATGLEKERGRIS